MKVTVFISTLISLTQICYSQNFIPSDAGSKVHFVINNFGFKVGGDFTGLKGAIVFNPQSLSSSSFRVSVNSASINTGNSTRDGHLRKPEYFDVSKYPMISFVSNKITKSSIAGRYYVFGNLTIKGITKPVEFGFSGTPSPTGYVFSGEFEINRRDFGVGGSSMSMSDHLKVVLEVAANK